jgi:UDP-glucose:(heptosyl)LPS alpha-1,3-glucosyltransferase
MATSVPATRRLRIAVLSRNFDASGGGAERYSVALVEQLADRHQIHVFAQHIHHQWPGVTYQRVSEPLRRPRWINQAWFALATWWHTRRGFDVVHSHENTWHGDIQTLHVLPIQHNFWMGRQGWKRVLRGLQWCTSPRLWFYFWIERRRYAAQTGRWLVASSDTLKDVMLRVRPQTFSRLRTITPGVAGVVEHPVGPSRAALRQQAQQALGIQSPSSAPPMQWLLMVANDLERKGLPTLLEALKALPAQVSLVVVGAASDLPAWQAKVKAMGLDKRVLFLGSLADVTPAYQAATVLVHPTLEDTFAMVVLEAMAQGLPVVVSGPGYCGISAVFKGGRDAVLLDDPRDAVVLAHTLSVLLSDPDRMDRIATAGWEFASGHLWHQAALQQEAIYFESVRQRDIRSN